VFLRKFATKEECAFRASSVSDLRDDEYRLIREDSRGDDAANDDRRDDDSDRSTGKSLVH